MDNDLKDLQKAMLQSKGHIEIDIDGGAATGKIKVNDAFVVLITVSFLIDKLVECSGRSLDEIIHDLLLFRKITDCVDCESAEQMDVMREILKKRVKE